MSASAEEWRDIVGHAYEVSSLGRVRRKGGNVLKPRVNAQGYHRVSLGASFEDYIHRLVCRAFHGEPPEADCHADHIDGDRANNVRDNVQWLTPVQNRAKRRCARGAEHHHATLNEELVHAIHASPLSDAALGREMGISRKTVSDVRTKKTWRHVNVG